MTLLFLFFFVGIAQAGEHVWETNTPGCRLYQKDDHAKVERICDGDNPISLKELACYQKMQEAMMAMDPLHHITLGELSRNKELQESMFKPAMKRWDATMKECVERDR